MCHYQGIILVTVTLLESCAKYSLWQVFIFTRDLCLKILFLSIPRLLKTMIFLLIWIVVNVQYLYFISIVLFVFVLILSLKDLSGLSSVWVYAFFALSLFKAVELVWMVWSYILEIPYLKTHLLLEWYILI